MSLRMALINPTSLVGEEIRQTLDRQRDWWTRVELFSTEVDGVGTVTQVAGEAAIVQALEADSLRGIDIAFLCAPGATLPKPPESCSLIVIPEGVADATGAALVAGVNLDDKPTGNVLLSAHPAVVLLANLLHPLASLAPVEATAVVIQPASTLGDDALKELLSQAGAILSFSDKQPQDVFGHQMAFNIVPAVIDTSTLTAQLDHVLPTPVPLALNALQGGFFHSISTALHVRFQTDPGHEALSAALGANSAIVLDHEHPGPGPITAAGRDEILVAPPKASHPDSGTYWIWAVMDNLTLGGALNALAIAQAVAVTRAN